MAKDRKTSCKRWSNWFSQWWPEQKYAGYKPVLGNNRFGYPSGGVPVRSFKGGGALLLGD